MNFTRFAMKMTAFNALFDVAPQRLANAPAPPDMCDAIHVSSLTALLMSSRRIRGIAAADSFRRLVTRSVVRQYQEELRTAMFPHNVGMSDRSGIDTAVRFLMCMSDMNSER